MRKIMIIGAGGIGSYLIHNLNRINQRCRTDKPGVHLYDIHVFDDDKVEKNNLGNQMYSEHDVGELKVDTWSASCTAHPYQVLVADQFIKRNTPLYDLVVCCADNLVVRRLLYRQGYGDSAKIKWLDLRAQGRNAALISYKVDENLVDALLSGPEGSFSCQAEGWDGLASEMNAMHMAIAGIAAQWIQRWWNDHDDVADKIIMNV